VFDLYTVHFVSVPYYTGLIAHLRSGALAAFHPAALRTVGINEVVARFAVNKPAVLARPVLVFIWAAYLCATIGLLACSVAVMRWSIVRRTGVESCFRRLQIIGERLNWNSHS
jgi:hypothetical protein